MTDNATFTITKQDYHIFTLLFNLNPIFWYWRNNTAITEKNYRVSIITAGESQLHWSKHFSRWDYDWWSLAGTKRTLPPTHLLKPNLYMLPAVKIASGDKGYLVFWTKRDVSDLKLEI